MIDVSERDREVAAHARISPTAHYTGYTWLAHGLSHPAFATSTGRLLYTALVPANRALAFAHQPNLDGMLLARHRLIDALADDGPRSLGAIAATLDPTRGTAIITEGLVNYFPRDAVTAMWARFARALARFPHGRYLSDLHLGGANGRFERVFAGLLGAFVRGRIHFHFDGEADALDALDAAGFDDAQLRRPEEHEELTGPVDAASARFVRILDASIRPTVGEAAAGL